MVVAALTSTGGGISRPRPLAFSSAETAAGSKASAATPYTVSVGITISSPRWIARPTGQVGMVAYVGPPARGREDGRRGLALDVGMLDPDHSPGSEQRGGAE